MTLAIERASPTTLIIRRRFAAPPARVYLAHIDPDLVRRWMCGEGGTTMPVCTMDARAGGTFRMQWREPDGSGFSVTGMFKLLEPPHRILHVETMHLPEPTPENQIETRFDDDGQGGTNLTMTMTLPDAQAADDLTASGMSDGLSGCYHMLDALNEGVKP